jgi:hypothetical protein
VDHRLRTAPIYEVIPTPVPEHCTKLPVIKIDIKFLMFFVKSNILGTTLNTENMQETNLYLNNPHSAG